MATFYAPNVFTVTPKEPATPVKEEPATEAYVPDLSSPKATQTPHEPFKICKTRLIETSPTFGLSIQAGHLSLPFGPRVVQIFFVWLYFRRLLLAPEHTPYVRTQFTVHVARGFLYDTLDDDDLAQTYLFAHKYSLRTLKNDVMTQLILQHYVADTTVKESAVRAVYNARGADNPFVEVAVMEVARRAWMDERMLPQTLDSYPSALLIDLLKYCASYARATLLHGRAQAPAQLVCHFHEHLDQDEILACREYQLALGLPYAAQVTLINGIFVEVVPS
ncbi:hypothetical protein PRZ48_008750 [Zasmidium cellare]|uniref:BTB domain-containing protein n=1 Tax=Zasmidium cellare TaxID=395010 RepID=A0ABR0EH37_ZASCE|nr:hypothetical protein PRZ48_008750 [Zasmidium cellare]